MKKQCNICGCIHDEYWMMPFTSGRSTQWLCWSCYKNAQREAALSDKSRQRQLYKISISKKRNK